MNRDDLLRKFVSMQYARNDMDFHRGTFRVRGDTVEIIPMYEELAIRIEFFGDEIENIHTLHPLTGEVIRDEDGNVRLPGLALRGRARAHGPRHQARSRTNSPSGCRSWRARTSWWKPSGSGCAPPTTSK